MGLYPPPLERLIEQLTRLPGIGQKSATRIALHVLRSTDDLAVRLGESLRDVKEKIHFCSRCFNFTDEETCPLCRDERRADGTLCIVEGPGDQLALEETGIFRGRYHILHGALSPLDGVGPEDLRIGELLARIGGEGIEEVILATNPTAEGEATASFIGKIVTERHPSVKLSRIALGVPMGADLKYMDRMTLDHAVRSRVPMVA